MSDVLLLEDHVGFNHQFRAVFDSVDCFTSLEDLVGSRKGGWKYAFIDFHLQVDAGTGFSALLYLQTHSPDTKVIVFTDLGGNGRTLFATAAYRWFGAWGLLDKGSADDATLRAVKAGIDPTAPVWRSKLKTDAWRIDELFQEPTWYKMWKVWPEHSGSYQAVYQAHKYLGSYNCRLFSERATVAAEQFQDLFLTTSEVARPVSEGPKKRGQLQVALTSFARAHSSFFTAPDLQAALDASKPWNQTRSRR